MVDVVSKLKENQNGLMNVLACSLSWWIQTHLLCNPSRTSIYNCICAHSKAWPERSGMRLQALAAFRLQFRERLSPRRSDCIALCGWNADLRDETRKLTFREWAASIFSQNRAKLCTDWMYLNWLNSFFSFSRKNRSIPLSRRSIWDAKLLFVNVPSIPTKK